MAALGADVRSFFIALALVGWPAYARLTRREWRRLKRAPFVTAARGLGFGPLRIHLLHILPNTLTPAIARALADVSRVLMLTLSLGYFGFGIPPTPEWGSLIAQGQALLPSAWWVSLFPGLAALLLALGLSWLADGLAARLGERG
jgi:peptide/nickel transport system permease protein